MTREEAIGRIQEHIRIHSKKEPFTPYLDEAFSMAIEALETHDDLCDNLAWYINERNRLLKEQRLYGKWIPCSERLPDEHGYYIVQTDGSHNDVIDIAEYGKFFRKPEYECVWEWNKASKIIAWMPLPEPYRREGDEK